MKYVDIKQSLLNCKVSKSSVPTTKKGRRNACDPLISVGEIFAKPPNIPSTVGVIPSQYFLASP